MVLPKPPHLREQYASQISDPSVAEAYQFRVPYPPELFDILGGLLPLGHGRVLEVGCGSGDLTLGLLAFADAVDAVDISVPMIAAGKRRAGGDSPKLRWVLGRAEDAALAPPYALVTAGESLHWMDWPVIMPRLQSLLVPDGVLAVCGRQLAPLPWNAELGRLIAQFSTNRDFRPTDLIRELTDRQLFTVLGSARTAPVTVERTVDSYIESIHSGNGFSRDRMSRAQATLFDLQVHDLVAPFADEGRLTMSYHADVTWGRPHGPD